MEFIRKFSVSLCARKIVAFITVLDNDSIMDHIFRDRLIEALNYGAYNMMYVYTKRSGTTCLKFAHMQ